jgi:hypothetical protein
VDRHCTILQPFGFGSDMRVPFVYEIIFAVEEFKKVFLAALSQRNADQGRAGKAAAYLIHIRLLAAARPVLFQR